MTFHYKESPVNELTNSAGDPVTKTAEFKVCAVRMEKLKPGEGDAEAAERAAARAARGAAAK
jgi:predicted molibdopterin-dependent oxidoreductase YjgC